MMDPSEISAMAGQIMTPREVPTPQQVAPPQPEDLMAMLGPGMQGAPTGLPPGMPPGVPGGMPPGTPPGMPPMPGMEQGPPTKPASLDLVPPGLKEEIAKYAASQQVQMSQQLLALAGPESSDVPAGRKVLLDIWMKRNTSATDEQIQQWKAEGKKPAWILANSFPGRYAIMGMSHWRPSDKVKFARQMAKLVAGQATNEPDSGQPFDSASLDVVADEDPTPSLDLSSFNH